MCFLARHLTPASLPEIGRRIGRDHSTVINNIRAIEARLPADAALRAAVTSIATALRPRGGVRAFLKGAIDMNETTTDWPETASNDDAAVAPQAIEVGGRTFLEDAKGNLVPQDLVKPQTLLEDEIVRKIIGFARDLSAQIARFRGHVMTDLGDLDALLTQEYGAPRGGPKGNRTYQSFDGRLKVQVQVSDFVDFGPELQVAKSLIDVCLTEWAATSRPEIQAIVTRAFNTDKEGQINRAEIFMLLRLDIEDARWRRAMEAVRDAMRITGSKEYVRFYERDRPTDGWRAVTVDLAKAG